LPKYVAPNLRGPKLVWVPSKSGWMIVGTIDIGGLVQMVFIMLITCLSQVMKSDDHYPNAMINEWSPKCYNIQVSFIKLWMIHWNHLMACKLFELKLAIGWSWANQGISLVDHFTWVHMSWLNWIYMQCCLLWDVWMDHCLVIKFELTCVG
jgi:hypothetical protein